MDRLAISGARFAFVRGERSAWIGFAAMLLLAPLVFGSGSGLTILCQLAITMIFGLSYNILLGQGGMLSFGHSIYSGLAAFCVAHAMNASADGGFQLPVSLMPLVGALVGAGFGVVFGWISTRKSGMAFAMITLGTVELVHASTFAFPGFFGGEAGISTNRVIGPPVLGISYGPQLQVYYLIAVWLFLSSVLMFAFTRTPLGRVLNAVRDNAERAEFIGYDARVVRYLANVISAAFAGVAGGLSAINFEIVNAESVSVTTAGTILLFTFIGGTGYFIGPLLGAVAGILLTVVVAGLSNAWPIYLGLFFIAVVVWAPEGLAGLAARLVHRARSDHANRVTWPLVRSSAAVIAGLLGAIFLVEMLYRRTLNVGTGSTARILGIEVDTAAPAAWVTSIVVVVVAGLLVRMTRKKLGPAGRASTALHSAEG